MTYGTQQNILLAEILVYEYESKDSSKNAAAPAAKSAP